MKYFYSLMHPFVFNILNSLNGKVSDMECVNDVLAVAIRSWFRRSSDKYCPS